MKQRISTYHWLTVATGLVMLTISNGLINSALPIFDEPLLKEFGWSRGELKFREFVTSAVAAALVFFSGALIDKFGAKRLMLIGSVFLASGYALYGQLSSKYQMYAIHILLATALVSAGTIATIVLISSWFKARRGLALGIALVGTSMGGLVFPKPLTMLIASYGWRTTMLMLAILPIVFFIWTFFLVRNTPQERGLTPICNTDDHDATAPNLLASGLTYAEATRTVMFWLIAACGMFTFYSVVGLLSNTFLYMRDLGYDAGKAALALSYFSLLSMTGKFLISSISDYISPYSVFAICCTGMCIGSLGYTLMNADLIWFTIPITALCWGGMYTLYNLITVKSFGLKATGKINGTISILESAGAALGPWLTGVLYDKTGSYQAGFMVISIMLACCSLVSYRFGKYALKEI
jgi:sugar phosphate permease